MWAVMNVKTVQTVQHRLAAKLQHAVATQDSTSTLVALVRVNVLLVVQVRLQKADITQSVYALPERKNLLYYPILVRLVLVVITLCKAVNVKNAVQVPSLTR